MHDEFALEEMRIRAELEKMDAAFCAAMLKAIDAGEERGREVVMQRTRHAEPNLYAG